MYTEIFEKMKTDAHIAQAIKQKRKKMYIGLFVYAAVVLYVTLTACFLAEFETFGWLVTLLLAVALIVVPFVLLHHTRKTKIFCGRVERIEEDRKIVPQKGTGAFGGRNLHTAEVRELLIAVTDENGETQVIFCPAQYEKAVKIGDVLLIHSALPYPAHLSNASQCICMHCGTMQASENTACITCKADIYSLHT